MFENLDIRSKWTQQKQDRPSTNGQHASANSALQDNSRGHGKQDGSSSIGPMCNRGIPARQLDFDKKPKEIPAYSIMPENLNGNANRNKPSLKDSVSVFGAPQGGNNLKKQGNVQQKESNFCKSNGRPVTTLMMTNIPCHLEVDDLALIIEEAGFQDCYDVLYLPKRGGSLHNMGFAVLNFNTTTLASKFKCSFSHGWTISEASVNGFTEILKLVIVSGLLVRV